MKNNRYFLILLISLSLSAFAAVSLTNYTVKEGKYSVKFTSKKIDGSFDGLKANIQFDKAHPELSRISASIDATTLSTGFFLKTNHAKDALGVDKYPTIEFTSTAISRGESGYVAVGKLNLKGTTRNVSIFFTFDEKGNEGTFRGKFTVLTKEFNITRSGTPEKVDIDLIVSVTRH